MTVHVEVLLACGYAVFLAATAAVLEWLGAHAHRRSQAYRLRGFTFHQHLDAWECPNGEYLHRAQTESTLPAARYRARAAGCNACPLKTLCTDSDEGREIVRETGDWVDTEVGRFHRGLSLALLALDAFILTVAWARHHRPVESALLGGALAGVIALAILWARAPRTDEESARRRAIPLPMSPWSGGGTPDAAKKAEPGG